MIQNTTDTQGLNMEEKENQQLRKVEEEDTQLNKFNPMTIEIETYSAECECTNCGWSGTLEIPKGSAIDEMECPECKVVALAKKQGEETK